MCVEAERLTSRLLLGELVIVQGLRGQGLWRALDLTKVVKDEGCVGSREVMTVEGGHHLLVDAALEADSRTAAEESGVGGETVGGITGGGG